MDPTKIFDDADGPTPQQGEEGTLHDAETTHAPKVTAGSTSPPEHEADSDLSSRDAAHTNNLILNGQTGAYNASRESRSSSVASQHGQPAAYAQNDQLNEQQVTPLDQNARTPVAPSTMSRACVWNQRPIICQSSSSATDSCTLFAFRQEMSLDMIAFNLTNSSTVSFPMGLDLSDLLSEALRVTGEIESEIFPGLPQDSADEDDYSIESQGTNEVDEKNDEESRHD